MPPVVTALLAFVVSLFQSHQALHLRILALQHQVSVYKRTVSRLRHLRRLLTDYLTYYHRFRTHLALAMDCPVPRPVKPPECGEVIAVPEVAGLHHHDERWVA